MVTLTWLIKRIETMGKIKSVCLRQWRERERLTKWGQNGECCLQKRGNAEKLESRNSPAKTQIQNAFKPVPIKISIIHKHFFYAQPIKISIRHKQNPFHFWFFSLPLLKELRKQKVTEIVCMNEYVWFLCFPFWLFSFEMAVEGRFISPLSWNDPRGSQLGWSLWGIFLTLPLLIQGDRCTM